MVLKGGERVTLWAIGFNALARALLVASYSPNSGSSFFIESRSVSPKTDCVPVSLATLLVRSIEKLKGVSPFPPMVATWLLMALQEGGTGILSKDSLPEKKIRLNETGDVIVHCVANKTFSEGAQVRLHMGRGITESIDILDNLKNAWNDYCSIMERRLLLGIY
ncbi:hypothetical protein LSM04_003465 [Trypanosoma melophagium]|uniref:uncharacterized protein n=1 Tax=Trypanosoma melophagium TaxID=715481 RepID=UPI003519FEFC|nr:hypothetical protein LSM04_003465 [Trypanosoma melophagium]